MSTFFDSLPDGMTADVKPPVCYVHNVPHVYIDLFESLIKYDWREVMYVNLAEVSPHISDVLWLTMPEGMRDLISHAKFAQCETLALQPAPLSGPVYIDENGNARRLTYENHEDHLDSIVYQTTDGNRSKLEGLVTLNSGKTIGVPFDESKPDPVPRSWAGAMASGARRSARRAYEEYLRERRDSGRTVR
jgi:hypothetical protein